MAVDDFNTDLAPETLKALDEKFDRQLDEIQSQQPSSPSSSSRIRKILLYAVGLAVAVVAPFLLLIRTSVYGYSQFHLNGWVALAMGVLATIVLLMIYAFGMSLWYKQGAGIHKNVRCGIMILVAAYTLYGVLYISTVNTKTKEVQRYYRQLHPILRISLATTTLADGDIVVTDIQRAPKDYGQMGLAKNSQSLHYRQSTGYVHAVDLRTKGRPEWKNWILATALRAGGLQTLRHVGTADHLHVYFSLNN